ncbi:MAG: glycosyltransferase [Cyanobacteria bacterium SZAS LIN-2]|nr:glycosyltransferase [Cyanobacteria bacterium SZAS LIN-3]MBS1995643.1 glycosyltransferase [Cyanobacteria bacterium SZAS LIN-2]
MLLSVFLLNTLFILGLYGLTLAFYVLLKPVETSRKYDKDLPFVSILVPARNEEGKIARCLESLLAQDYPNFELVVIDDRSTDRTGEIIAQIAANDPDKRIKFVHGEDAPSGWIGKCNALAYAVGHASGDWFIFTDADTFHHKNSVRDAVSHAMSNKIDLLSFVPMQELGSFSEVLIMPVLLSAFLLGDPFHTVNDPKAARAYAYGQYILCRRSSYLALGGHHSVRDEIVEDHALARVFKEKGYKIEICDGKSLYSVRMYTDLESLWLGWTKNLYSFIESNPLYLILLLAMEFTVVVMPWIWLFFVASIWVNGEWTEFLIRMSLLVMVQIGTLALWFRRTSDHFAGVKWYHFFLTPFGLLAVTALYLHSAYLVHFGGQVNWKGRRYVVNKSRTIQPSQGSLMETPRDAKLVSRDVTE